MVVNAVAASCRLAIARWLRWAGFLIVLSGFFPLESLAATNSLAWGESNSSRLDPITREVHYFRVAGVDAERWVKWNVNGVSVQTDHSYILNGFGDPTYKRDFTTVSGTNNIVAFEYDPDWNLLATHSWSCVPAFIDLQVIDVWTEPGSVSEGQNYVLKAKIANTGNMVASAGATATQKCYFYVNRLKVGEVNYDDLKPYSHEVVNSAQMIGPVAGDHLIAAVADATSKVTEWFESNNGTTNSLVTFCPPDLVFTSDPTVQSEELLAGQNFALSVQIANTGCVASAPCSLRITWDGSSPKTVAIESLPAQGSEVILLTGTAPVAGDYELCLSLDSSNIVHESSETNNQVCTEVSVRPGPKLAVHPGSLRLDYSTPALLNLTNQGNSSFSFKASADRAWMMVTPTNGICASEPVAVSVAADPSGLLIGSHTGVVHIASSAGQATIHVTVSVSDQDRDGLPDGWETRYYSSTGACNPYIDFDNDGQSNMQEWIGGSDPTNALSNFRVASLEVQPQDATVKVSWPTLPSRVYDLLWASDPWGPFLPLGQDLSNTESNYIDTASPRTGFYKVRSRIAP